MQALLFNLIIPLAVRFGVAKLVDLLVAKAPSLKGAVNDEQKKVIEQAVREGIEKFRAATERTEKKDAVRETKQKVRAACIGVGCPTDLKGE